MDRDSRLRRAAELKRLFMEKQARLKRAKALKEDFLRNRPSLVTEQPTGRMDTSGGGGSANGGRSTGGGGNTGGGGSAEARRDMEQPVVDKDKVEVEGPDKRPAKRRWPRVSQNFVVPQYVIDGLAAFESARAKGAEDGERPSKLARRRPRK